MGLLVRKGRDTGKGPPNGNGNHSPEGWGPPKKQHPFSLLKARIIPDKFAWDDLAQQIVGAMVLSAPLAVTSEVWDLSGSLDWFRISAMVLATLLFNILLIYYTKYQSVESERILGIVPTRLFSQVLVSYSTAFLMLYMMGVIGGPVTGVGETIRLVAFVGLFSNIGAGAADLLK